MDLENLRSISLNLMIPFISNKNSEYVDSFRKISIAILFNIFIQYIYHMP